MAESAMTMMGVVGESSVSAGIKPTKFLDKAILPQLEKEMSSESLLEQAKKMLSAMEMLKPGQSVEMVGELLAEKTKIKIVGEGSEKAKEVEFSYLNGRYRKLESEALKSRQSEREEIEVVVAKYLGKTLPEMGIKFASSGENYLSKNAQVDVWKKVDGKPVIERMSASEIIESLQSEKISYFQAIKNLKKVYGSLKIANEKYISQMALGKVFDKSFEAAKEHSEAIAKQAEMMDAVPESKKGFFHKVRRASMAVKQTLDKPLGVVGATAKALTGLALFDYNPVRMAVEKPIHRIWTEIPISTSIPEIGLKLGSKFPKLKKLQEIKGITMREAAAKLEENLLVEPLTGEGIRTGAIANDQIREASVAGAEWALKMQVLPGLIAKIPAIEALALKPADIYSMIRSSKMGMSGVKSIQSLAEKFRSAKTNKEKGMLVASTITTAVGFYAAEKLAAGGAINPILMGDIALMRLVGKLEEYAKKTGVEKTELAESLKTVEEAITVSFAADSVRAVGESLANLDETGSTNPLASIDSEDALLKMVQDHPEYLQDEGGSVFGDIRRAEEAIIAEIKGHEVEESSLNTFSFEDGVVYQVGPGEIEGELIVLKQTDKDELFERKGDKWVEIDVPTEQGVQDNNQSSQTEVMEINDPETEDVKTAVHDYVYYEQGTTKMAFRMDLVQGETWESKVDRLFDGYKPGAIDDPSGSSYLDGKVVQAMENNSPELRALTGQDGVYESQIHEMLIQRLIDDANNNGLVYDQEVVKERMVAFLKSDTTADADTVEGEIDYGELYKNLFLGSEVTKDVASIDTQVYQSYFLSGNEGSAKGVEVNIEIPDGGTVIGQLAEQGYGTGDGKIFNSQSEELTDAKIFEIEDDGTEREVVNFDELNDVQAGDKFVVRTGEGSEESLTEGEMPEIVDLIDSEFSSFDSAPTENEAFMEEVNWEKEVVRNENGEIYVGTVAEGQVFTQMMVDRFSGTMDNPWDLLPAIQNMDANGMEIYAESVDENGVVDRRVLNSYDDLGTLYVGERVVIVDTNRVLEDIPDLEKDAPEYLKDLAKDDLAVGNGGNNLSNIPPVTPGFTEDGRLDLNNLPQEAIRDTSGYIYVGEIQDGMYLSTLISSHLPASDGVDVWQQVDELNTSGQIEIYKVGESGELIKMVDLNSVNIGDKIVVKDSGKLLSEVETVDDSPAVISETPIEVITNPESPAMPVEEVSANLEVTIAGLSENNQIGLTVIDLDNVNNRMEFGNDVPFDAKGIQKLAIAMAVMRSVDSGVIDLEAESRFVILPGDYKPSIEHLLNLMLVQDDATARDGLLKELVGQDMDVLLGADTGLKEVLSDSEATTTEVAKVYQTLLRTNYLSDESRELVQGMIEKNQVNTGGLLADDLALIPGVEVTELSQEGGWSSGQTNVPQYSSYANVHTADGKDLVVVMTSDSENPADARSAFKTVARELIQQVDENSDFDRANELGADVAKQVFDSDQAKLDYVNHVVAPYRNQSGEYVYDKVLESEFGEIVDLDLANMHKDVATYADGSGLIHMFDPTTGRMTSVFVGTDQHVSMVLDSKDLADHNLKYEVYPNQDSRIGFSQAEFNPESEKINLQVSLEIASNFEFQNGRDRINFVDVVRAGGKDYDFYLFVDNENGEEITIMYGRDGSRVDRGALPTNVSIAVVSSNAYSQLSDGEAQAALDLLIDKLSTTKEINDIEWIEGSSKFSVKNDEWDNSQHHWFGSFDEKDKLESLSTDSEIDAKYKLFQDVVRDIFQIEVNSETASVLVDGVSFSRTIFIPEGMQLDTAVIARTYDINQENLVVRPTSDANVYLVGEKVDPSVVGQAIWDASFTHASDRMLYQYKDGTLTTELRSDLENPLVSIFPLESPLDSYLDTDRLVKLDEKVEVKLQYQGKPYFVLSEEGVKDDVYLDPYTLESYVKTGQDFIPLVTDSYTFSEIAKVYGQELNVDISVTEVWEHRITDAIAQEARKHGVRVVNESGDLVIYGNDGTTKTQVLTLLRDGDGGVQVSGSGELVLVDGSGKMVTFEEGKFVTFDNEEVQKIGEYLQGYEYMVGEDGKPLQYRGFPVISKNELVYIVNQNGVALVGSKQEFKLEGYIEDGAIEQLMQSWQLDQKQVLDKELPTFETLPTQAEKIVHGLGIENDRLLTIENGVMDLSDNVRYEIQSQGDEVLVDSATGKSIYKNQNSGEYVIWNGEMWEKVERGDIQSSNEYLEKNGLVKVDDENGRGEVVDRRTQASVYVKDGWVYTLENDGLVKMGQLDAVIKSGFIGYLDNEGNYQTYTPETLLEIFGNPAYSPAERASLAINPMINSLVGTASSISDLWGDFNLENVLPSIKQEDYVEYDALPSQYVAALIAQENKTIYRGDEGEATNLDLGVVVKVLLSGGDRGGSTLVQGLVKNLLISPEERLQRSLSRKVDEVLMADQVLQDMPVEEVVAMYANSVSYGSVNGHEITGVGEAAEFLFGKDLQELDLVEIGLLVALPNYPTRNNVYSHTNAVGWADSASGVYRHMYENGFISEAEMEEAFLEVHERVLPSGTESEVELLIKLGAIDESDRDWAIEKMAEYQKLKFDERQIIEDVVESPSELNSYGVTYTDHGEYFPPSTGVVEEPEKIIKYTDFFSYLNLQDSARISSEDLEVLYKGVKRELPDGTNETARYGYFWYGKTLVSGPTITNSSYLKLDGDITPPRLGVEYTTRQYDPEAKDYTPRVEIGNDGNVIIDSWAHRYEAIEKDESGNTVSYNVVSDGENGSPVMVQDNKGNLWEVSEGGLVSIPGKIYKLDNGEAVLASPVNDRPGILFDTTGKDVVDGQYVQDALGNYYSVDEEGKAVFVGQIMNASDGRNVLFNLDNKVEFELATDSKTFLDIAVKNVLNYRNISVNVLNEFLPISNDPNVGYVAPRGQGEYGLINPLAAENYLSRQGITSEAIELSASRDGRQVFETYLEDLISQDKAVLVWLNSDLATDVIKSEHEDGSVVFESISRFEKPVSVLQIFEFEGSKYVVYQDPTQLSPQVISFELFSHLASPSDVGRFKTLVMGKYEIRPEYSSYLYDPNAQYNQVGNLMADGYVYNTENPGAAEELMSINPLMQSFVSEEARKVLEQNGGSGVVAMAMDQNGRVVFDVGLDENGQVDPEVTTKTYQPGSAYKPVTAMWAMYNGVNPNTYYQAGDYREWEEGDKTYNWTMDPVTGALRYSKGADATMTMSDAIKNSNNPYFLGLVANSANFNSFAAYARAVGFGDGKSSGNVVSKDSIVPDPTNPENTMRSAAYNAIGQADVAIAPKDLMEFMMALSNGGRVVTPVISRELPTSDGGQLPNASSDYAVMLEAMQRVTSEPGGTAYEVFHDVEGYEVYGKTGTAETGEEPNAWFVGWAVNKATGEKLSFVFLIPNGGEGSHVAAPLARKILDEYFSNLNTHKAMEVGDATVAVDTDERPVVNIAPTPNIFDIAEVEQGVDQFRLEDQPNKELIILATLTTDIANRFVPSSPNLNAVDEGKEFVRYLKNGLSVAGYGSLANSSEMEFAFDNLLNEYKDYGGVDPNDKESIQCVAWQIFMGGTNGLMDGAPVAMNISGNAEAVVYDVISQNLQTGSPSPILGGTVVRFANDMPDISLMDPGDSFFVKYPGETDSGHTGVILAEAYALDGQPMVLVSDANRFVDENGVVISDGKIRLRWLTQAQFDEQFSVEGDRQLGIAPSQFVVIRPEEGSRVQSVLDPNYHSEHAMGSEWLASPVPEWKFVQSVDGNLQLPFENSEVLLSENVGEMKPVESIFIHWSGAASTDTSTWTAEMVQNGLIGEETSSTFAVGVDKILQMAKFNGSQVQETYATPWQHGAINIEIAGQDFDNNPPSKEQYQKVVELVTQLLVSSNKPVSIVQPHYGEIYMWSSDMPNRLGEQGNWMKLDSMDLTVAKYWDDASGSWLPVSETTLTYDPASVQSKADPGEKFFAQLTADVQQRLIALGRADLAESGQTIESTQSTNVDLYLRIIDKENPITREEIQTEIEPNLVSIDAVDSVLAEAAIGEDIRLHNSMVPDLKELIVASRDAGIGLYLSSGYRSFEKQMVTLFENGGDDSVVTLPGQSQHHSGLAIDFTSPDIGYVVDIDAGFEMTSTGIWLRENGWKYGFVQSYTKNHDGVENEPWHYYYVGKAYARIWHDSQMTDNPKDIFEILDQINSPEG